MTTADRAAKESDKLLPCYWQVNCAGGHVIGCPAAYRFAVAAKLREAYMEIERLSGDITTLKSTLRHDRKLINVFAAEITHLHEQLSSEDEMMNKGKIEIAQLHAINQKLWSALTPEKRHELNLDRMREEKA